MYMHTIMHDEKKYVIDGDDESYCVHGVEIGDECRTCEDAIDSGEYAEPKEE